MAKCQHETLRMNGWCEIPRLTMRRQQGLFLKKKTKTKWWQKTVETSYHVLTKTPRERPQGLDPPAWCVGPVWTEAGGPQETGGKMPGVQTASQSAAECLLKLRRRDSNMFIINDKSWLWWNNEFGLTRWLTWRHGVDAPKEKEACTQNGGSCRLVAAQIWLKSLGIKNNTSLHYSSTHWHQNWLTCWMPWMWNSLSLPISPPYLLG